MLRRVFALTLALAVLVGVSLGLLGGGGSILTVPLLVYVAGEPVHDAAAESLLVVLVTSLVALVPHARAARVRWRTGLAFGLPSLVGGYAGGRAAHLVDERLLLGGFAVVMLLAAVVMIRGRRGSEGAEHDPPLARSVLLGLAIGTLTGLLGAGGGFVIVPALVLLAGLPMPVAVGTSLLVIALNSAAGFLGHLPAASVDWRLTLGVLAAAIVGVLLGSRLTGRVPADRLRVGFGWFVLAMGVLVLAQQVV